MHLARLRARLEFELRIALERRNRHAGAESRVGHRQVNGREDVVSLANETRIGLHVHEDVRVSGLAAQRAFVSLARDPDALAVVDSCWNLHVEPALLEHATAAIAPLARGLDDSASPAAARTGLRADEIAEHAARHLLEPSAAAARDAGDRARSRLRPTATALLAGHRDLNRHRARDPPTGPDH